MKRRSLLVVTMFSCLLALMLSVTWMRTVKASFTWTVNDDLIDFPAANFRHIQDAINAAMHACIE